MTFSLNFKIFLYGLFSVVFLIFLINSAQAYTFVKLPIICSFAGPENSPDFLRLSDFIVSGPSNPKVGDTINISFKIQNYSQYDLNLGSKGIFVAVRDPTNSDASFGFTRANTKLKVGETVSIEVSKNLDRAGSWKFWPSYQIISGKEYILGPNEWHVCQIQVMPQVQDLDQDGIPDEEDNCPKDYNPQQEDVDGDKIGNICDSCDDRDSDQDRIKNCQDQCPAQPENYNQYQDEDGCPDEKPEVVSDSDKDGILDDKDKCPNEKETFNNYQDTDGCPDQIPESKPTPEIKPTHETKPISEEKLKEREITPEFISCLKIFMLKAKLPYEQARQKCSKEKAELIKDFAKEIKEINLVEISLAKKIKINNKTAILDGIEIPPLPLVVDIEDRNLKIEPSKKGLIIEEDGVGAEGNVDIEYEDGKIFSVKSKKQIKILPSQIGEKIADKIKEIKIEDKGTPKYLVKTSKRGKLFGFIPFSFSGKSEVDATDGNLKEKKPWFAFLVKALPTCKAPNILVANSCCVDENYNKICDNKEEINITTATTTEIFRPETECGNKECDVNELKKGSCCEDCGCPTDFRCQYNRCVRIPSRPTFYTTSLTDSYIVVTLDEMTIHDDQDPAAAGELQLITLAATNDKAQTMYWPVELWRPVNSGSRILGSDLEKIPIFSLKENQMGEKLALSFRAIDNDDLPAWLDGIIEVFSAPFGLITKVIEFLTEILPLPHLEAIVYLENELESTFNDLIADNETIGSVTQIYDKSQNWGAREEPYVVRGGGLTVKYSIKKVIVPKNSEIGVKINKVLVRDTGDYFDGEVWFRLRCANNFGEGKIEEVKYRIPRSGTYSWGGNNTLEGPAGPSIEVSPGVFRPTTLPIIECKSKGPFAFVEIAVWDEDEPNVADDHDLIGHFTETVLYPEARSVILTVPWGNIDVWLEYTKK